MALRKHGTGQILKDEAKAEETTDWTPTDDAELIEENKDKDEN